MTTKYFISKYGEQLSGDLVEELSHHSDVCSFVHWLLHECGYLESLKLDWLVQLLRTRDADSLRPYVAEAVLKSWQQPVSIGIPSPLSPEAEALLTAMINDHEHTQDVYAHAVNMKELSVQNVQVAYCASPDIKRLLWQILHGIVVWKALDYRLTESYVTQQVLEYMRPAVALFKEDLE